MAECTDRLAQQIHNADTYLWRAVTQLQDPVIDIKSGAGTGQVENKFAQVLKAIAADAKTAAAKSAPAVDAVALAAALATNQTFIDGVADAIVRRIGTELSGK